jgi:rod shape-determining protein MreD
MQLLNSYWIIYLSFFCCLVASIVPLPIYLNDFRPDWVVLIIFYWVLALPHRVSTGHAFVLGLLLDLLLGSTLGMHAILFSLLAYFIVLNYQRFRYFPIVQTTFIVGACILVAKLALYWLASSLSASPYEIILHNHYFWSIFISMFIWPWFFLFMRLIRIRYKVI